MRAIFTKRSKKRKRIPSDTLDALGESYGAARESSRLRELSDRLAEMVESSELSESSYLDVEVDPRGLKVGKRDIHDLKWLGDRGDVEKLGPGDVIKSGTIFFDVRGKSKRYADRPYLAQLFTGYEVEVDLGGGMLYSPAVVVKPSDPKRGSRITSCADADCAKIERQVEKILPKLRKVVTDRLRRI